MKIKQFGINYVLCIMLCLAAASMSCGEKKAALLKGKVTFLSGNATLQIGDGQSRQLAVSDTIDADSTVKTGDKSFVFIQFSETSVVKVQENSVLKLDKLATDTNVELILDQGQVISKIKKLGKGESFSVKTPTVVASVRGTQFSVAYGEGKTNVSVSKGKVSVGIKKSTVDKPADSLKTEDYVELKEVEAGKTATVDKDVVVDDKKKTEDVIVVKDINDTDKTSLKDIEAAPIIEKLQDKKPEEIKEIYKPVIENPAEKKTMTKAEKNARQKELIQQKSASEAEIKETFDRIDEITLFNKNVIRGVILSRGDTYTVLTSKGTIKIKQDDISNIRVIK